MKELYSLLVVLIVLSVVFLSINTTQAGTKDLDPNLCGSLPRFRCFAEKTCDAGWTLVPGDEYVCPESEGQPFCCYLYEPDEYYPEGTVLLELSGAHQATFRIFGVCRISDYTLRGGEGALLPDAGVMKPPVPECSNRPYQAFVIEYEEGYEPYKEFFVETVTDEVIGQTYEGPRIKVIPPSGIPKNVKMTFKYKPLSSAPPFYGNKQPYSTFCYLEKIGLAHGQRQEYLTLFEGITPQTVAQKGMPAEYNCENTDTLYGFVTVAKPFTPQEWAKKLGNPQLLAPQDAADKSPVEATFTVESSWWRPAGQGMSHIGDQYSLGPFVLPISKHLEGKQ